MFLLKKSLNSHTRFNKEAIQFGHCFGIKQSVSETELDEKERDEDEVEFSHPNDYFQLDAATMFGVLVILDDCISKEEFAYVIYMFHSKFLRLMSIFRLGFSKIPKIFMTLQYRWPGQISLKHD